MRRAIALGVAIGLSTVALAFGPYFAAHAQAINPGGGGGGSSIALPLTVPNGGTGLTSGGSKGSLIVGNGAASMVAVTPSATGQIPVAQGVGTAYPIWKSLSGDCTLSLSGAITCTTMNGAKVPAAAPVNYAPNSQWEIWSGVGYGLAEAPGGAGPETTLSASGNTVKQEAVFTGSVAVGTTTLTVGTVTSGAVTAGTRLVSDTSNNAGSGISQINPGTTIVSGSGSTWTLNQTQPNGLATSQTLYSCNAGVGTGFQTDCGYTTFTMTGGTGDLSVGDLVTVSGAGVDASLTAVPMRVTALPDASHITVRVPRGLTPTVSAAATITPIQVGAQWYTGAGTGSGPDGWGRFPTGSTTGPILWRDFATGPYAGDAPDIGTPYAVLGVRLQQALNSNIAIQIGNQLPKARFNNFRGHNLVFGAYVMQKTGTGGTFAVNWNIGGGGFVGQCTSAPKSLGTWQWVECSEPVAANATSLAVGIQFQGNVGDVYYVADPVLAVGTYIGGVAFYQKPPNEVFRPYVHIAANYWINQQLIFPAHQQVYDSAGDYAYGFTFDPYAETGGQIAPTVYVGNGFWEGYNGGAVATSTGYTRIIALQDCTPNAGHQGLFMPQQAVNVKQFVAGDMPFMQNTTADWQGTMCMSSAFASDTWNNVSWEFDSFILQ